MMTYERYKMEYKILTTSKSPIPAERFGLIWDDNARFEVVLPICTKTEFFGVYKVKMYGMERFPEEEPIVTPGMILRDRDGKEMTEPSRSNHLLGEYNGETHMCIYSGWNPLRSPSLYKTANRAAVWLLVYHLHLKTGRSMDSYLSHGA